MKKRLMGLAGCSVNDCTAALKALGSAFGKVGDSIIGYNSVLTHYYKKSKHNSTRKISVGKKRH